MVFKCDKCPYTAKSKTMVRIHQLVHSDLRAWKCQFPGCSISFKSKSGLTRHKVSHEGTLEIRKRYRCEFNSCERRFISQSNLNSHIATKHTLQRARNFQCSFCTKSFFGENVLKNHIQSHVKELRISCRYCEFSTYSEQSLSQHTKILHEKPVVHVCTFPGCKFSSAYSRSWADHVRLHDPDPQVRRPFPCSFPGCDFRGSNKGNVNQHFRARHKENRTKGFKCSLCPKAFYSSVSLIEHLSALHTNENFYRCGKCSYLSAYSANMSRHMREKHGTGILKRFECETCGYRANSQSTIRKHTMNMHGTAEKRLKCDKPGCTFKTNFSSGLKRHLLVHGDDLQSQFPFACTFTGCDFRRKIKSEMVQHELQHETCKVQLKCKICSKGGYPDKLSLHFHSFNYHDQKSWKCSLCDYAASHKCTLQRHIKTHHNDGSMEVQGPGSDRRSRIGTGTGSTTAMRSAIWKHFAQDRIPVVILQQIGIHSF